MFGELIGLWAAAVWRPMGSPDNVRLVELGPGRGTHDARCVARGPGDAGFPRRHRACIWSRSARRWSGGSARRLAAVDVPVSWHRSARRRAGRAGDRPRQRVLRRAAGPSGRDVRGRLARARGRDRRRRQVPFRHRSATRSRMFDEFLPRAAARRADRRDFRVARRPDRARARPPRRALGRRRADHRLRPCRERDRRHAAGGRPARLSPIRSRRRGWSISPPMSTSRRWRRPPRAWARACTARSTQARVPAPPRHRAARGRAQARRAGGIGGGDRRRARPPHQRGAHRHGPAVQGDRPCRPRSSARCPASKLSAHRLASAAMPGMTARCSRPPRSSRSPGIRHAFFTRDGGVSDGVYASLNGGTGSHDAPAQRRREPRPHGGGARRRAGPPAHRLPGPFARRGDRRAAMAGRASARAPTPS